MQVLIEVLWVNANSFELSRSVTFTQTLWAVYTLRSVTVRRLKCERARTCIFRPSYSQRRLCSISFVCFLITCLRRVDSSETQLSPLSCHPTTVEFVKNCVQANQKRPPATCRKLAVHLSPPSFGCRQITAATVEQSGSSSAT